MKWRMNGWVGEGGGGGGVSCPTIGWSFGSSMHIVVLLLGLAKLLGTPCLRPMQYSTLDRKKSQSD